MNEAISERFFHDIIPAERDFSCVAVAFHEETNPEFDLYGCDGIYATEIGGYKTVYVSNLYGKRIDAHFHCDHNLSHDDKLLW